MTKSYFLSAATILLTGVSLFAESDIPMPTIQTTKSNSVYIRAISDNGKWGVITLDGEQDGNINPGGSVIVDLSNMKETKIQGGLWSGVNDVTDDGNIVVGLYEGLPAYYNITENNWIKLPLPQGYGSGYLSSVSADGKYAVGSGSPADNPYFQIPLAYNLTTGKQIQLTGLPTRDMTHLNQNQMTFDRISGDGRYALGVMSFSYIQPASLCTFVYDLQNHTYKMIGFTESATSAWTPKAPGLHFVDAANMSPNGRWVTGQAYMVKDIPGSQFANEYITAFRYDVENDAIEVYDELYDADISGINVTNDGVVLGTTPAINPYSETMIRRDGYWYSLRKIFEKAYGIDIEAKAHVSVTGKPVAISADGLTSVHLCSQRDCYVLKMGESFLEASQRISILGMPETSPANNSDFAQISQIKLKFDRKIELAKAANTVILKKEGTQLATAINTYLDGNEVTIVFRTRALEKGVHYTVEIPAGYVTLVGDASQGSEAITLNYVGRGTDAVQIVEAQPADGATFAYIDATANPLMFTFDTQVKPVENACLYLYEDGIENPISELQLLAAGNQIIAYPLISQRLYKDVNYTVKFPAGSVTDLTGIGPNAEYLFHYTGNYVREVEATGKYLFFDECDNRYNYMSYDGDGKTPIDDLVYWNFTSTTPWVEVRENNETVDMALASHSMYKPAGQSDDWLMTPQLYIPDDICYLQFLSQSYKFDSEDRLKVYIYPSDNVYHRLDAELVDDIRMNGVLVYNEIQSPGSSEENLSDDWVTNKVDLSQFAGKNIYIAFLNDNDNQSAVFIDNVCVVHDVPYSVAFTNAESVVNLDEIAIKGVVTIASEIDHFSSLELKLIDKDGKEVSSISESNLNLNEGDIYDFEFPQALKLDKGVENNYKVILSLGENQTTVSATIKNMLFKADKNVVIEEFTGSTCPNCPKGILAIENLERYYSDRIIPIGIHTYSGDRLNSGMDAYSAYLGLNAAPSGRVNRGLVSDPMAVVNNEYRFSGTGVIDAAGNPVKTWFDLANEQVNTPAEAIVEFTASYDKSTGQISIPGKLKFALSFPNRNVSLFTVLLEHEIEDFQLNNLYTLNMDILGDWGNGGRYGQNVVNPYTQNHVARGVLSTLYSGTPGLIPAAIEAGVDYEFNIKSAMPQTVSNPDNTSIVVMALDNDTFEFINAAEVKVNDSNSIDQIAGASNNIILFEKDGVVYALGSDQIALSAYTLEGVNIANAYGCDSVSVDLRDHAGIVIVKVTTHEGAKTAKIAL